LYGDMGLGGANNRGLIYSAPVTGGTPTTLYSFPASQTDTPRSVTINGSTLYGLTSNGFSGGGGVYSFPLGGGNPATLASFSSSTFVSNGLLLSGSTLYGMTAEGGTAGNGAIYSLPVTGGTPTDIGSFNGTDGSLPLGGMTLSADGTTFYGLTAEGGLTGTEAGVQGAGVVFSIPVTGGTPTVISDLNTATGWLADGNVTLSADGSTIYGMTTLGGANELGTIFSVPTAGGSPTVLFSFDGTHGENASGALFLIGSTLYGTAESGGANNDGIIFGIPVTGGTPTILHTFSGVDGADPTGLTLVGSILYGTTVEGGSVNGGTVFALSLVPEPSSVVLFGLGSIGLAAMARRRQTRMPAA
jgi:uncharacterized repeat protein (TIGR03803 family)